MFFFRKYLKLWFVLTEKIMEKKFRETTIIDKIKYLITLGVNISLIIIRDFPYKII